MSLKRRPASPRKSHNYGEMTPDQLLKRGIAAQMYDTYDAFGILLECTRLSIPAWTLPPAEHEALIQSQIERVEREMASLPPLRLTGGRKPQLREHKKPVHLPLGRRWDSLRVCNCSECGKTLLGESDEPVRKASQKGAVRIESGFKRRRKNDLSCLKFLPPPVAFRDEDGPLCLECNTKRLSLEGGSSAGSESKAG